jgi:aminoglycoside phosphotransferase (APT) family kinase protein
MTDETDSRTVSEAPPGLDPDRVEPWITAHVAEANAPLSFALMTGGHSNLTYDVLGADGGAFVLRRPPLGTAGDRAHDMGREFRIIAALRPTAVPVPDALALCEDIEVNGAPFYVMSRVNGQVIDNPAAAENHLSSPSVRRRAGQQIVDVLADLHRVDIDAVGIGDAARREGFLDRQIKRFSKVWERNKTRELPAMDKLAGRLLAAAPPQRHTGIVHSDYRLGNVILDSEGTLAAVLDWELWTLGDVLADLGFLLNNWYEPGETTPLVFMEVPPTVAGGFGSRDDVIERYAARTGFDVSAVGYYRAFQYWKVGVLAEGVKRRYESQQMASADVDFAHLNQRVLDLVELATDHLAGYNEAS